jgi:Tol biopolymer transport system component
VTLDDAGGSIVTFDVANGEIRETVADAKDASCQRGLAWSPDGTVLAFGGPGLREGCGDPGNWGIWVWQPGAGKLRQLFQGAADAPLWLANGEVVAMVSEPSSEDIPPLSILRFHPDGRSPEPVARDIPRMFPQPPRLIQAVGNAVLFPVSTCDRGEAHLWSLPGPASQRQTPGDVYAYRPSLAPDGRSIAYVRVGDAAELVVAPTGQGEVRVVATAAGGLQVGTVGPFEVGGDWSPDGTWIAIEVTDEQFRDCVP